MMEAIELIETYKALSPQGIRARPSVEVELRSIASVYPQLSGQNRDDASEVMRKALSAISKEIETAKCELQRQSHKIDQTQRTTVACLAYNRTAKGKRRT
jgi:hypothetical protein